MSDDHVCADNKTDACPEFYPNDAAAIHRVPAPTATTKPDGWKFANSLNHSLFSGKSSGNFGVAATVVNSLFLRECRGGCPRGIFLLSGKAATPVIEGLYERHSGPQFCLHGLYQISVASKRRVVGCAKSPEHGGATSMVWLAILRTQSSPHVVIAQSRPPTIEGVPRAQNRHLAPFRLPPSRKAILHTLRCSDLTGIRSGCGDSASKLGLLRRGHRFEADVEIIVVGGRAVELHRPQARIDHAVAVAGA